MNPWWRRCCGVALIAVGILGIVGGLRALVAATCYQRAKYGWARRDADAILSLCEASYALYPSNYFCCLWAAEAAYADRSHANGTERPERMEALRVWTERGVRLNPYQRSLRLFEIALLERSSLDEAIRALEEYVGWHFWYPANHAILVDRYARAGELARAEEHLYWSRKGTRHYRDARRALAEARRRTRTQSEN